MTVIIKPINTRDMPDYFVNDQAEADTLAEQMDFYHAQIRRGDLWKTFLAYWSGGGSIPIAGRSGPA